MDTPDGRRQIAAMTRPICFLGFGEASQTFCVDPAWRGDAQGFDVKTDSPALREAKHKDFVRLGVEARETCADAVADADMVLSLVTADQALTAARSAAPHLKPGSLYCDMNSVSPATKRAAAALIEAAGGRYVDVAIMSPVKPAALAAPLLLSGACAQEAETQLRAAGFSAIRRVGVDIGRASRIKMIRSVMIKGIEALTAECLIAAEAGGVVEEVVSSFGDAWPQQANYNLERMLVHGQRRAAELQEVAGALQELGVQPRMTEGASHWQQQLGQLGMNPAPATLTAKLGAIAVLSRADAA